MNKRSTPFSKKIWILMILFSILFSATLISQNRNQEKRKDKIQAYKVAFMTRRMDLTPEESQKFWPIYNAHEKKLQDYQAEASSLASMSAPRLAAMSDKEVEEALKAMMTYELNLHNLRIKLHDDLKKILPVRKVALFYMTERDFKKEMIKMAIEKREAGK